MFRSASTDSIMLFGSAARGELRAESDVDVLVIRSGLAPMSGSVRGDSSSCSSVLLRPPSWLRAIAAGGQLFALHLQLEGKVLRDPTGVLATFRRTPVSVPFDRRIRDVRRSSSVLHAVDLDCARSSAMAVVRHLLRTAVFLHCARSGAPTFSHERAAEILRAPELTTLLSKGVAFDAFPQMRQRLEELVGPPDWTDFSLHELARTPTCQRLALQLLADDVLVDYDPEDLTASEHTSFAA